MVEDARQTTPDQTADLRLLIKEVEGLIDELRAAERAVTGALMGMLDRRAALVLEQHHRQQNKIHADDCKDSERDDVVPGRVMPQGG
jgi:hypothetical protein